MTIADRMAVFMDGRIVQIGTPEEVFGRPATADVANFLGSPPMNLVPGRLSPGTIEIAGHCLPRPPGRPGDGDVTIGIRPGDIGFADTGLPATVVLSELLGDSVIVDLLLRDMALKARLYQTRRFAEGEPVHLQFDPAALHFFDPNGNRLNQA